MKDRVKVGIGVRFNRFDPHKEEVIFSGTSSTLCDEAMALHPPQCKADDAFACILIVSIHLGA
eukprot:15357125-Ditylum_brightwellii.AAC.2